MNTQKKMNYTMRNECIKRKFYHGTTDALHIRNWILPPIFTENQREDWRKKYAVKIAEKYGLANGSVLGRHTGLADCIASEIAALPTVDVVPIHCTSWEEADWCEYDAQSCETIHYPKAAIVCTGCRNAFKKGTLRIKRFCPACGSKMEDTE